jgi:hypothetical protein
MKENSDHMIYPNVSNKQVARNYNKFLRRHGWKSTIDGLVQIKKEDKDEV